MAENINIILFILGLFLYLKSPKYVPLYFLLWPTFIMYFVSIVVPFQWSIANQSYSTAMNYIWVCTFVSFIIFHSKFKQSEMLIFYVLGAFLLYIVWLGYIRGGLQQFQGWARGYFCFVPLWIQIRLGNIKYEQFKKYIIIVLCIQLFLGYFQRFGGVFYAPFTTGLIDENGTYNITGTLTRYNAFADHISLLMLSLLFILSRDKVALTNVRKGIIYIMLVMGYVLVFIAGARTELFALTIAIPIFIYMNFPKQKKTITIVTALVFLLYVSGITISLNDSGADKNNVLRQKQLIDIMSGKADATEGNTLALSALLLEEYISEPSKMLTGPGKLFNSKFGYQGRITSSDTAWDSFLALLLCETGLLGYSFLIFFLYLIIGLSKEKKVVIPFLIYLLIVSTTDEGLFRGTGAIFLLFSVYYTKNNSSDSKLAVSKIKGNAKI